MGKDDHKVNIHIYYILLYAAFYLQYMVYLNAFSILEFRGLLVIFEGGGGRGKHVRERYR